MEKYIWKIINKVFLVFIIVSVSILIVLIFYNSYQKLRIFNQRIEIGVITNIVSQEGISSETHSYQTNLYTIQVENRDYYAKSIITKKYKIGSIVKGYVVGNKSFILTYVDNQKVGNKYSFIDYVCFLLSFLIIVITIYKLIKTLL